MFEESYLEFMLRWYTYRRWKKNISPTRQAEFRLHKMLRQVPADSIFVDLGANVGSVSIAAAKHNLQVISFEPDPLALKVLRKNTKDNDRITVIPKAVGSTARTDTFHQRPDVENVQFTQSSSLIRTGEHDGGQSFDVEVINIVDFLDGLSSPVSIVKMDIEGAEAECMEAILDAGWHRKVGYFLVETHERFSPELDRRISALRKRIADEQIENVDLDWV